MPKPLQPHACLWCGATRYSPSLEHIIPEALGCPTGFVLREGVCDRCNNGLGHVDQALVRQFEIQTVMAGLPRKKGRRPTIDGWAPLHATHSAEGPTFHLNAGPGEVTLGGRRLKPAGGTTSLHSVTMTRQGPEATLRFSLDIGRDPKFLRALYKVGLETIAYFHGPARALDAAFNPVRAFVRTGVGRFGALVLPAGNDGGHEVSPPFEGPDGLAVAVTLFGVAFLLDLSSGQKGLDRLETELWRTQGAKGWSRLG